jgi:hypothetical protein
LRQSTIGAEAFDGRVRDGIGSYRLAEGHQAGKEQFSRRMTANGYGNSACADPISVVDIPIEAKLVFSLSDRLTRSTVSEEVLLKLSLVIRFLIPSVIKPNGRLVPVS